MELEGGTCGLVGRATTFVGNDVGSIPTCVCVSGISFTLSLAGVCVRWTQWARPGKCGQVSRQRPAGRERSQPLAHLVSSSVISGQGDRVHALMVAPTRRRSRSILAGPCSGAFYPFLSELLFRAPLHGPGGHLGGIHKAQNCVTVWLREESAAWPPSGISRRRF